MVHQRTGSGSPKKITNLVQRAAEAEAYRRDVPDAEIHILDAEHFALDKEVDEARDLDARLLSKAKNLGSACRRA